MATLKQRLHRKNPSAYDIIHLESSSDIILRSNGIVLENSLIGLPKIVTSDSDPADMMSVGEMRITPNGTIFVGCPDRIVVFQGLQVYQWAKYNATSTRYYTWDRYEVNYSYNMNTTRYPIGAYEGTGNGDTIATFQPILNYKSINKVGEIRENDNLANHIKLVNINNNTKLYMFGDMYGGHNGIHSGTHTFYEYGGIIEWMTSNSLSDWYTSTMFICNPSSEFIYYYLSSPSEIRVARNVTDVSDEIELLKYTLTTSTAKGRKLDAIESTNQSAYPANGIYSGIWYISTGSRVDYTQGTFIENVISTNQSEYPSNGIHTDGYWYVRI